MTAAGSKVVRSPAPSLSFLSISDLVLLRVASRGATRADLQRDLGPLVAPKTPGTLFRRAAEMAIGTQTAQALITESKGRLSATAAGVRAAGTILGLTKASATDWDSVRCALLARALGLPAESPLIAKAQDRADSLAAIVLQQHFKLSPGRLISTPNLRAELAVVALERAFGNKIKTGLGKGSGLPGKAGRMLAGQLLKSPREFSSDGKLILALAAEVAGSTEPSLEALTLALLRRVTSPPDAAEPVAKGDKARPRQPAPNADNDAGPLAPQPAFAPRLRISPDMGEFASAVIDAARPVSEGWPGNRKAFISRVWGAIRSTRPDWELSEIAFKSMLAEAHRSGQLVLTSADLKDKCDLRALEDSKILYKNTVWHFVRVED